MLLVYSHTDHELLQKIAAGDQCSFETLYNCYYELLVNFVKKYVKAPEAAQDIVQEVFTQIWEKRESLVSVQLIRPYLFAAARNRTFNFLKKASREEELKAEIMHHYVEAKNSSDQDLLHSEYIQFIERILSLLPQQTRQVFRMCREYDQSYEETAARLRISRNAVKKHMVRAHKFFREKLLNNTGLQLFIYMLLHFIS